MMATPTAFSADVIRYCILHHFGGVYVDMDMECLQPLDAMLPAGGFVGVYEPPLQARWLGMSSLFSNAFLASIPATAAAAAVGERDRLGHGIACFLVVCVA